MIEQNTNKKNHWTQSKIDNANKKINQEIYLRNRQAPIQIKIDDLSIFINDKLTFEKAYTLAIENKSFNDSNVYDPGWIFSSGEEVEIPISLNDSPMKAVRLTFRMDNNNSTVEDGFVTSVTISRKLVK